MWQDRWLKLTASGLFYFKKKDSDKAQGLLPTSQITTITIDEASIKDKKYRFDVTLKHTDRVFSFRTNTEAECRTWVEKLQAVLADYQDNTGHYESTDPEAALVSSSMEEKIWKNTDRAREDAARRQLQSKATARSFYGHLPGGAGLSLTPNLLDKVVISRQLAQLLFGDFKVMYEDFTSLDPRFGRIFVLGDSHFALTHNSYLIHMIEKNSIEYLPVTACINNLAAVDFPLFVRQIHRAETLDASYAVYHPPVRPNRDALYAYLDTYHHFPEDVVRYVAVQLALTIDYAHQYGHVLNNLSTETVFFDGQGYVRVFDHLLGLPPGSASHPLVEYICPESAGGTQSIGPTSDYWRLGIMLYEIFTGLLPFRLSSADGTAPAVGAAAAALSEEEDILQQIKAATGTPLPFPTDTTPSNELRDLISKLLVADPASRLSSLSQLKAHPFFAGIKQWDINFTLNTPQPRWIHENVLMPLVQDTENTPINLTLHPSPVVITRLGVSVLSARGLTRDAMTRLYCAITVEGDRQITKVASVQPGTDCVEWNESFVIELASGSTVPEASDIVFELQSKKREAEGRHPLVGSVLFPVNTLRHMAEPVDATLTIHSQDGIPVGELAVRLMWREDDVEITSGVLSNLSQPTMTFLECFGAKVSDESHRLISHILDQSFAVQQRDENADPEGSTNASASAVAMAAAAAAQGVTGQSHLRTSSNATSPLTQAMGGAGGSGGGASGGNANSNTIMGGVAGSLGGAGGGAAAAGGSAAAAAAGGGGANYGATMRIGRAATGSFRKLPGLDPNSTISFSPSGITPTSRAYPSLPFVSRTGQSSTGGPNGSADANATPSPQGALSPLALALGGSVSNDASGSGIGSPSDDPHSSSSYLLQHSSPNLTSPSSLSKANGSRVSQLSLSSDGSASGSGSGGSTIFIPSSLANASQRGSLVGSGLFGSPSQHNAVGGRPSVMFASQNAPASPSPATRGGVQVMPTGGLPPRQSAGASTPGGAGSGSGASFGTGFGFGSPSQSSSLPTSSSSSSPGSTTRSSILVGGGAPAPAIRRPSLAPGSLSSSLASFAASMTPSSPPISSASPSSSSASSSSGAAEEEQLSEAALARKVFDAEREAERQRIKTRQRLPTLALPTLPPTGTAATATATSDASAPAPATAADAATITGAATAATTPATKVKAPAKPPEGVDPESVPGSWKEVLDAGSGKSYFYNKYTRRTTWTRPAVM